MTILDLLISLYPVAILLIGYLHDSFRGLNERVDKIILKSIHYKYLLLIHRLICIYIIEIP